MLNRKPGAVSNGRNARRLSNEGLTKFETRFGPRCLESQLPVPVPERVQRRFVPFTVNEPGSSIMLGKVNPTQREALR
jgi:hypothetical protein